MRIKISEDGEGGVVGGDIGGGESGIDTADIMGQGPNDDNNHSILGIYNFSWPVKLGKIKKRLLNHF